MSDIHSKTAVKETTVATAAVPARGVVQAAARVETTAGEKFAAAAEEHRKAAAAAAAMDDACAAGSAAQPVTHAKAAFGDLGTTISAGLESRSGAKAMKTHADAAVSEEKRAHTEKIEAKEKARLDAIKEAEAKANAANKSKIISEYREGKDIVVVAEVPARGMTTGTGVAESHAEEHLLRSQREKVLAAEAAAKKADADARYESAKPGQEAKAAVGSVGSKISSRLTEAKGWFEEKLHEGHGKSYESQGEKVLARDIEAAREKAKKAAEEEANRLDRAAAAVVTSEKTTSSVSSTRA